MAWTFYNSQGRRLEGASTIASDVLWDAAGDLVQGTGADSAARLALGAVGTVVRSTGATNAYALPPGHEFDYAQITAAVTASATTEATANAAITGAAVTYDGSTIVEIVASFPFMQLSGAGSSLFFVLYEGASSIGRLGAFTDGASTNHPVLLSRRCTPPSGALTYSVRIFSSDGLASIGAGAGGSGVYMPAFLRITKV